MPIQINLTLEMKIESLFSPHPHISALEGSEHSSNVFKRKVVTSCISEYVGSQLLEGLATQSGSVSDMVLLCLHSSSMEPLRIVRAVRVRCEMWDWNRDF